LGFEYELYYFSEIPNFSTSFFLYKNVKVNEHINILKWIILNNKKNGKIKKKVDLSFVITI